MEAQRWSDLDLDPKYLAYSYQFLQSLQIECNDCDWWSTFADWLCKICAIPVQLLSISCAIVEQQSCNNCAAGAQWVEPEQLPHRRLHLLHLNTSSHIWTHWTLLGACHDAFFEVQSWFTREGFQNPSGGFGMIRGWVAHLQKMPFKMEVASQLTGLTGLTDPLDWPTGTKS